MHYAGGPAGLMREPYTCVICGWTGLGADAPLHPCMPPIETGKARREEES